MNKNQLAKLNAIGHVFIRDVDTDQVLVDKYNSIHFENFSEAIVLSLAKYTNGFIEEMHFGNGGSVVSATGMIDYYAPNVTGVDADLYNPTYFKVVNNRSQERFDSDPAKTNITYDHKVGNTYTDIIVKCTLDYGEPSNQEAYDNNTNTNSQYTFDELGLKTYDPTNGTKRLLTHVIFNPFEKSLNRSIEIIYTIRISMV